MPIFSNHQMNYLGNTIAVSGDPYWDRVVCLLNGEDYLDKSKRATTYTMTTGSLNTTIKKFGSSSYYFPGTNGNRLATTYDELHHMNGYDYTIEFWVYPTQWVSGKSTIMGSWNAAGQTRLYGWLCQASAVTNQWQFYINHAGSAVFNSPVQITFSLTLNAWNHVAYCKSGNTHRTFVNGTLSSTVTDSTGLPVEPVISGYAYNAATSSGLWFGENEDFNQQPFKGYIDEIRITKGVARYTSSFTAPTEPFPTTGVTVTSRTAKTVTRAVAVTKTATKKFGTASAYFDGNTAYLRINDLGMANIATGDFTIEFWFNQTNVGLNQCLLSFKGFGSTNDIRFSDSGFARYYINSTLAITESNSNFGTWNHFALVRTSGTTKMYINGVSTTSISDTSSYMTFDDWYIGYNPGTSSDYTGYIDEFRVSNTARYTANFTPPSAAFTNDSNTMLLLHMDGADNGTTFTDDAS